MAMIDGDWSIDRATGNIRYIGYDHIGASTVTDGSFVVGDYYMIRTLGTTDFVSIGASADEVGVRFEATGTGGAGGGTATQIASYATVIQFHRWIAAFADNEAYDAGGALTDDDEHDIIDQEATARSTDNIITLNDYTATGGVKYNVDATAIEHLYDGTIIQGSGVTQERWDGIVNFGNANAHIQVLQDGAIASDDYWNYGWQKGTHTGGADAAVLTDSSQEWTTDEWIGYTIKNVTDGSQALITANTATTITGILYGGTEDDWDASDAYNIAVPLNGDSGQGISHRFMIKTREEGVDIDRRRLIGTTRRYYNTYGEFKINGTSQGNNVFALSDSGDLNNTTAWATIDALVDITNTEGLRLLDIAGDGSADEEYYSEWTRGSNTINVFYEYLKMMSADSNSETLQGENGELHRGVTHAMPWDAEGGSPSTTVNDKHVYGTLVETGVFTGGPFTIGEAVHEDTAVPLWKGRILGIDVDASLIIDVESGTVGNTETLRGETSDATAVTSSAPAGVDIQNSAGECKVLAYDDDTGSGNFYVQTTKGVATLDNTRLYDATDHTDYYDLSADAVERTVSTPFVGASTGSALIAAYGLGMVATDTAKNDKFFQLSAPATAISPPNTVTFTASGFISGDYVLCTENDAGDIKFNQLGSLDAGSNLTTGAETTVEVTTLPTDTPLTAGTKGGIRVERDSGLYSLHRYTAIATGAGGTFTIPSSDFSGDNATHPFNVFVSYLDLTTSLTEETFQYVYSTDRTHFLRVRDGGASPIKTAESTGTMGDTGGVASVNRIDDD